MKNNLLIWDKFVGKINPDLLKLNVRTEAQNNPLFLSHLTALGFYLLPPIIRVKIFQQFYVLSWHWKFSTQELFCWEWFFNKPRWKFVLIFVHKRQQSNFPTSTLHLIKKPLKDSHCALGWFIPDVVHTMPCVVADWKLRSLEWGVQEALVNFWYIFIQDTEIYVVVPWQDTSCSHHTPKGPIAQEMRYVQLHKGVVYPES